jgi:Ca2+-binding EF-hand superfamily protein
VKTLTYIAVLGLAMAGGLMSAAAAPADTTPEDQSSVMSKIDTDHDGSVSLDEAKKAAIAKFDTLDTDKEGTLDANELTGILSRNDLIKADKDKDGTLDAKELSTEQGRALVALLAY